MNGKRKMGGSQLAAIACVGLALLGFNGVVLLTPVAGADCEAACPGGQPCSCSGKKCNAEDGVGCTGSTGDDQSVCECNTF